MHACTVGILSLPYLHRLKPSPVSKDFMVPPGFASEDQKPFNGITGQSCVMDIVELNSVYDHIRYTTQLNDFPPTGMIGNFVQ